MNATDEKQLYQYALETGLLNGTSCYRRVDAAIQDVEEEAARSGRFLRGLLRLAIPAAALLVAGTAVAAGIQLTGKGSRIPFFDRVDSPAIEAQQAYYERHSDVLEDTAMTDQGNVILKVENIAIHKEKVAVFFRRDKGRQVTCTLSINNGEEREPVRIEEADTASDQSCMASFVVFPEVPKVCNLTVRFYGQDGSLLLQRDYGADLSQSEAEGTLILSGQTVRIDGTHTEEPEEPPYRPYHDHEVTIESVRLDRDGGHILLSESILPQGPYTDAAYAAWAGRRTEAKEAYFEAHPGCTDLEWTQDGLEAFLREDPCPLTQEQILSLQSKYDADNEVSWDPFINFAVTDEKGVSLMPQLEGFTGSSGQGPAINEILFTPREGTKAIRITPLYYAGETEIVRALFTQDQSAEEGDSQKLELVSFTVDTEKRIVIVSYRTPGIRILDSYSEFLLDRQGEPVFPDAEYQETHFIDASSGIVTSKIRIVDDAWDMDVIGGYGQRWSMPYPDESKTVTIRLEP